MYDVAHLVEAGRRVDHAAVLDQDLHASMPSLPADDAHHRHAHRDAEGHLRQDHALPAVDHRRIDLDAAVDRARVHDDRVRLGQRELARASGRSS